MVADSPEKTSSLFQTKKSDCQNDATVIQHGTTEKD